MFEHLYDVTESSNVNFIGCISDNRRYDFAIVYSSHFFGKPLVVCMQTGRSAPLSADDLSDCDMIRSRFLVPDVQTAEEIGHLLRGRLPALEVQDQY
ncbi:DUF3055 domain-containing protein [Cohnella nanjingensis]|uniref:DUF3055 domain-containing protein n=1 Tax=Cohnella nanjingensis TaxID=1387779 RepID=A0A7X0RP65_9BACL|nr:DUF3055 domain-containing protein [Cohnella nanjingensis]MBB6671099.1 DUF3055 domain-containing protein [Cohnella nanjingensis]